MIFNPTLLHAFCAPRNFMSITQIIHRLTGREAAEHRKRIAELEAALVIEREFNQIRGERTDASLDAKQNALRDCILWIAKTRTRSCGPRVTKRREALLTLARKAFNA